MELDYSKEIAFIIEVIDDTLISLGDTKLLNNKHVLIINETKLFGFMQFKLYSGDQHIPIFFEISDNGVRIDLDRASETIYLSFNYIERERVTVVEFLQNILTCFYIVEYRGAHYTKITLVNTKGISLGSYRYYDSVFIIGKKRLKLFFPIYPHVKSS
jgi:hypothetical protein